MNQKFGTHRLNLLHERFARVESLVGLGEVTDVKRRAEVNFPVQRLQVFQNGFQEGGLARAVGTDQRRTVLTAQHDVFGGKKKFIGIANF